MSFRLFFGMSIVLLVCILEANVTGMQTPVFGADPSIGTQNDSSFILTDIDKNVKTLTISGKDSSGNDFQIDLILNKDMIGLHQMMMEHMSMMGGMGHMGSVMNSSSMGGMMSSGSMGGMMKLPSVIGQVGKINKTAMQSYPCMQMMKFMQNQYIIEGGMITIGPSTYLIDSGNTRIVGDKIFLNVHAGSFKAGKIIVYGKLNQNGGLKGILLLPEMRNVSKITGTGSLTNAFQ